MECSQKGYFKRQNLTAMMGPENCITKSEKQLPIIKINLVRVKKNIVSVECLFSEHGLGIKIRFKKWRLNSIC